MAEPADPYLAPLGRCTDPLSLVLLLWNAAGLRHFASVHPTPSTRSPGEFGDRS